jgi:hypothetical protein
MNKIIENAKRLREAIVKASVSLDDATASTAVELFPRVSYGGNLISAGTRINWNGIIKRAAVDLWDTEENNPENTPTLWEDINYRDGYRIIPKIITTGTAFAKDEFGWWNDTLYKSLLDDNVWSPDEYAAGWQVVIDEGVK